MDTLLLEPSEPVNEKPKLDFEPGCYTIPEILDSHLLPLVVQYDSGDQPLPLNKRYFDLTQPLLLYKKRNIQISYNNISRAWCKTIASPSRSKLLYFLHVCEGDITVLHQALDISTKRFDSQKVAATSLQIQGDRYEDLGESLLIPEDYKGWFAVLQRITGCIKADDAVPHFASVEELANSNTEKFLIGGTKKIAGLQILDRSGGQIKHEQRCFLPGDTLNIEKIEFGEAKKRSRLFRKPKYIRERFLLCLDESDREILLPFEQQGIFYQVSHKSGKPTKNVLQMSDIVARKLTPRIIKLVFGRFPVTPCAFTGLMKAESSRIESSVIASTIVNQQNILIEIPVNNHIRFKLANTNDDLRQNSCYRNAMHFCAERASTYMRNIKICYNFTVNGEAPEHYILNTPPPEQCSDGYIPLAGNKTDEFKLSDKKSPKGNVIRYSDISVSDEINLRPGKCLSTSEGSRMSFCFGNSYLTVPMLDGISEKRSSGNNNTISEIASTSKRGSRISFNGKFLEMEGGELAEEDNAPVSGSTQELPPPMPCTNISSYINVVPLPSTSASSEFPDYIPASLARRPSSQPPDSSPPPIPLSSSTSGVSSGSLSSVSDRDSKRASSDSCEYDVPKAELSSSSSSTASRSTMKPSDNTTASESSPLMRTRRPSTYTFAEGCVQMNRGFSQMQGRLAEELEETQVDVDSPIYENIQSLMEECKILDTECEHIEQRNTNLTNTCSSSDESLNELRAIQNEQESMNFEKAFKFNSKSTYECEYCEPPDINVNPENTAKSSYASCYKTMGDISPTNSTSTLSASPKTGNSQYRSKSPICEADSMKNVQICNTPKVGPDSNMIEVSDNGASTEKDMECVSVSSTNSENDIESNLSLTDNVDDSCVKDAINKEVILEANTDIQQAASCFGAMVELNMKCSDVECDASMQMDTSFVDMDDSANRFEIRNFLNRNDIKSDDESVNQSCSKGKFRPVTLCNDFFNDRERLCLLTSAEIKDHLQSLGLRDLTLTEIERQNVNGTVLCEVLYGEKTLRKCLPGVNLVDQQKISMFLRGWRPQNE